MRFWIPVLLLLFLLGCRDKVGPTQPGGGGGGGGGGGEQPQSYIPKSPGGLHANITVGIGIALAWHDSSSNETHFEFCRGTSGTDLMCGTLAANSESFFDSVGMLEGPRFYQVRAVNDSGSSAWDTLTVNYLLESNGLIPLRAGNWWEYRGSGADTLNVRRRVEEFRVIGGRDYYRISDSASIGGSMSSQYYLRNSSIGVFLLPTESGAAADTLFPYPQVNSGFHYFVGPDSFIVLRSAPGQDTMRVGDVIFRHVVSFQRFLNADRYHSIRYYLVADSVGIIREEEWQHSNMVAHRDIVNYHVGN